MPKLSPATARPLSLCSKAAYTCLRVRLPAAGFPNALTGFAQKPLVGEPSLRRCSIALTHGYQVTAGIRLLVQRLLSIIQMFVASFFASVVK